MWQDVGQYSQLLSEMMQSRYGTRRSCLLWIMLAYSLAALPSWDNAQAQSEQCTGVDLTCLEEDRDPHGGYCFNVSYKRITLAGRDHENFHTGWYLYSHRGGGIWPLDPINVPVWENIIEDLELLRRFEPPLDEVNSCFLGRFRSCYGQLEDDEMCLAAQYIYASPDECALTLQKMSLPIDSPAQWYGAVPDSDSLVPLTVPGRSTPQQFPVAAYARYGGSHQVLRWLELPESIGIDHVNVCELRDAYRCYEDGEHAGDAATCAELFIGGN